MRGGQAKKGPKQSGRGRRGSNNGYQDEDGRARRQHGWHGPQVLYQTVARFARSSGSYDDRSGQERIKERDHIFPTRLSSMFTPMGHHPEHLQLADLHWPASGQEERDRDWDGCARTLLLSGCNNCWARGCR